MRFITLQSADFYQKPEEDTEEQKKFERIFGIECKYGIAWAIPFCDDPVETITRMALTQPNYPHALIIFETDIYRAVDKIAWEQHVKAGDSKTALEEIAFIPEKDTYNLEYFVPFQELKDNMRVMFLNGEVSCVLPGNDKSFDSQFSKEYSRYIKQFMEMMQHSTLSGDADQMSEQQRMNGILALAADLYLLPVCVAYVDANFRALNAGEKEFQFYFPPEWGKFATNQVKTFGKIKNGYEKDCFDGTLSLESYRKHYDKMYWFYSFLKEENSPYIEVADRRKTPCPCGSGKKFKNCHGKDLA